MPPPRALSPARSPTQKMPSPRPSPAMRPSSPLSPSFKPSPQSDSSQAPRAVQSRAASSSSRRRGNDASLNLSSLPRYHPLKYPSVSDSLQSTPLSTAAGQNGPLSPRSHQRVLSDVQRHFSAYQRETVSAARASSPGGGGGVRREKPRSPRLAPSGSPGVVMTPLELAGSGSDGYLVAGLEAGQRKGKEVVEIVDGLIRGEARRRRMSSQGAHERDRP
ncbi:hypothetical protein LTR62_006695 [Meristemomyces frigidus]|uniref:Uncharacterized protein n=1 Tax=Meristemomyces frigidus TaxID=1508187 RepID=A0AAN7YMM3_9PEZI|nr:hypothetical protein LTR62_006695 [Meristemomyces frigidus]